MPAAVLVHVINRIVLPQKGKAMSLKEIVLEIADDLCHGCRMSEYSPYRDPEWEAKYVHMHRPIRDAGIHQEGKTNEI